MRKCERNKGGRKREVAAEEGDKTGVIMCIQLVVGGIMTLALPSAFHVLSIRSPPHANLHITYLPTHLFMDSHTGAHMPLQTDNSVPPTWSAPSGWKGDIFKATFHLSCSPQSGC